MKRIQLTQGYFAIIDDNDYESVVRFRWHILTVRSIRYAEHTTYLGIVGRRQRKVNMLLHSLIMRPSKGMEVDHRNHDGLDCRRDNMRICTHAQNIMNQRPRRGCSSQYKGVSWYAPGRKNWRAYIRVNGVLIFLGAFRTEDSAAIAYDTAAQKHFGEYAFLNFREIYDAHN